jgi:amino acid adenylation domain-containing protein/non-ribosomal peptide synthase protein (TIGR01720 family)
VSWRILLEDLSTLYHQYLSGVALSLPKKTDSFRYWQEKQLSYAQSTALQQEEMYWSEVSSAATDVLLPDHAGSNRLADSRSISFTLDREQTAALTGRCYAAYKTEINDILLTGLGLALSDVFGLSNVLVNLEGHGREDIGADTDISRTMGWFTSVYPVRLDLGYRKDVIRQLLEVKEHLHRVPKKGIGYGILKYLCGKNYAVQPSVTFNYLGDFSGGADADNALFKSSDAYHGREVSAEMERDTLMNINGIVRDGCLHISMSYSEQQFDLSRMESFRKAYQLHIEKMIGQLVSAKTGILSPVDLTYRHMNTDRLLSLQQERKITDIYSLSPLQEGLYYHWVTSPDSPSYFEQMSNRLQGRLDVQQLKDSYRLLVARHAALRTCFMEEPGHGLLQVVQEDEQGEFIYEDFTGKDDLAVDDYRRNDRQRGFNLHTGSQARLSVLALGNDVYEFIWSHHHILMDGWCGGILIREFFEIYDSLVKGAEIALGKVYPYANYISWLEQIDKQASLAYWKQHLSGFDTVSQLPGDRMTQNGVFNLQETEMKLDSRLYNRVSSFCRQQGVTESTFIQTVWSLLLGHYNNSSDVVFGAVVSGRPGELVGVEEMIGLFSNTIPVRVHWEKEQSFADLIKKVQQSATAAMSHHYLQLAEIQAGSEAGRELFNHLLIFENYPVQDIITRFLNKNTGKEALSWISGTGSGQTSYDFTLTIVPGEELTLRFSYNNAVYTAELMNRVQACLYRMITGAVDAPQTAVDKISYLSESERRQLVFDFNNTVADYPATKTVVDLFEEQVRLTPHAPAVIYENTVLTYRELNEQANQLAHYLKERYDIKADDLIGILLERSEWVLVTVLGILKAGGAYVPVDVSYPAERISYIITNSACKLLIDEGVLQAFRNSTEVYSTEDLQLRPAPEDLAYVIYTSGSTGQPKGVMIAHDGMLNHILAMIEQLEIDQDSRIVQNASFTFDISVWQLLTALLTGGATVIYSNAVILNPPLFINYLAKHHVTVLQVVPSYLIALLQDTGNANHHEWDTLKYLLVTGETAAKPLLKKWFDTFPGKKVVNAYGPAEAADDVSLHIMDQLPEEQTIPVGKPIRNMRIYILDRSGNLCGTGMKGEICVAGIGVGRGYIGNKKLTEKSFTTDPFRPGEKMYRTGDLGRWLADGSIEFLGRMDNQVKVRGYRIELGEIESVLQDYPGIEAVVAVVREHAGNASLIAYMTGKQQPDMADIKAFLSGRVPPYMLPQYYVFLDHLPLTPNGKIDRKQLPDPADMDTSSNYIAPRSETEKKMALIWKEVLDKEQIGVNDHFFELGGHSIKVLQVISRIHEHFGVRIDMETFFTNPYISTLADYIDVIASVEEKTASADELLF